MVFKWNEPFMKIVSSTAPAYFIQNDKKYRDAFPPQIPQEIGKVSDPGEDEVEPVVAAPKGKTVKGKKGK